MTETHPLGPSLGCQQIPKRRPGRPHWRSNACRNWPEAGQALLCWRLPRHRRTACLLPQRTAQVPPWPRPPLPPRACPAFHTVARRATRRCSAPPGSTSPRGGRHHHRHGAGAVRRRTAPLSQRLLRAQNRRRFQAQAPRQQIRCWFSETAAAAAAWPMIGSGPRGCRRPQPLHSYPRSHCPEPLHLLGAAPAASDLPQAWGPGWLLPGEEAPLSGEGAPPPPPPPPLG